ncbi:YojF family protein [Priestia megaterium]|uniref:YojF family protein n=1 Tax=Priestia megaterium TaxID=1404 RepID=UPI00234F6240|nr:YojF family protein [Priestia megaterium]MDC7770576.1 YojF family protein [Priestia megaterium]
MQPIHKETVQKKIQTFLNKDVYVHLETTNGAYASHVNEKVMTVGAFIRNGKVTILNGKITGEGPYRVGLQIDLGWIYAEGLTDWEIDEEGRLLLAGHDFEGRLAVALQLSEHPFS